MMATLRALAEPNRFHIVELLRGGPRPVGEMVDRLGLRQPQVSKHLRVLSDAGLVDVRVDAQRRIYALRPAPLRELEVWLERYRRIWESSYGRLDALLVELKSAELKSGQSKSGKLKSGELKTGKLKTGELKREESNSGELKTRTKKRGRKKR